MAPSLDELYSQSSVDNKPSLDDIYNQSSVKPTPEFSNEEDARKANIIARHKQDLAQQGTEGINPYVNALGETAVRSLSFPTTIPAGLAQDAQRDNPEGVIPTLNKVITGQTSPGYGDVLKGAGVPDNISKPAGVAMDVALYPGGAGAVVDLAKGAGAVGKTGLDAVGNSIGDMATNTGRYFSRIKNRLNPQNIDNINVDPQKRLSNLIKDSKSNANSDIASVQGDISKIKQESGQQIKDLTNQSKDLRFQLQGQINESRSVLKKNLKSLNEELQSASESGSQEFQKKLPDFFHANSEAYGTRLDNISDTLANSGSGITKGEVNQMIDKTLQDMKEALVPDGPSYRAIEMLKNKYSPNIVENKSSILDSSGNPASTSVSSNSSDVVGFKELIQDLKNVRGTLSAGARNGTSRFSQEDLAVQFLNNNLGNYVKVKVPQFAKLQEEYQPVIKAMKESNKIFLPNQGEFNTLRGTNFLRKAGMGKLEAGQEKLLDTVEKGSSFAPGVGDLSSGVKSVGNKMKGQIDNTMKLREQLRTNIFNIDKQKQKLISSTQENVGEKVKFLEKRKDVLGKRLNDLEKRRREIEVIQANKENANKLKGAIKVTGSALGLGKASRFLH